MPFPLVIFSVFLLYAAPVSANGDLNQHKNGIVSTIDKMVGKLNHVHRYGAGCTRGYAESSCKRTMPHGIGQRFTAPMISDLSKFKTTVKTGSETLVARLNRNAQLASAGGINACRGAEEALISDSTEKKAAVDGLKAEVHRILHGPARGFSEPLLQKQHLLLQRDQGIQQQIRACASEVSSFAAMFTLPETAHAFLLWSFEPVNNPGNCPPTVQREYKSMAEADLGQLVRQLQSLHSYLDAQGKSLEGAISASRARLNNCPSVAPVAQASAPVTQERVASGISEREERAPGQASASGSNSQGQLQLPETAPIPVPRPDRQASSSQEAVPAPAAAESRPQLPETMPIPKERPRDLALPQNPPIPQPRPRDVALPQSPPIPQPRPRDVALPKNPPIPVPRPNRDQIAPVAGSAETRSPASYGRVGLANSSDPVPAGYQILKMREPSDAMLLQQAINDVRVQYPFTYGSQSSIQVDGFFGPESRGALDQILADPRQKDAFLKALQRRRR